MDTKWLKEALFAGMTSNAFKLGTTLTLGWFWARVAGCSVLYRGFSMEQIDFENILSVAEADAATVSVPNYAQHNNDTSYFYVIRRSNGCGVEEYTLNASVRVSIDVNGELADSQPSKACEIKWQQVDGNKIQIIWYYCPVEQQSAPAYFKVYYDAGTGQIDYEDFIATICYAGHRFYSHQSNTLGAGEYLFAVRAVDIAGTENCSLARIKVQLNAMSPDAVDILSAEAV
ncbi:MAG: hypothetical protein AMJ43_06450 [Coxiella sp. DG_40]|nr:MAG: hypothetical protein AMJ43_06450 [Coxiella sp. DG_40]